jgi:16S rRNA C967 or C1407 C5-methylase (RsmB/RsmF family)/NOL1/NOP2/fmu family ribosome biogenesis protein
MKPLPELFLQSLEGLPGYDRDAFVLAHETARVGVSLRLNPDKVRRDWLLDTANGFPGMLFGGTPGAPSAEGIADAAIPVPWCRSGFTLDRRPPFVFDPLFHGGAYYVQEASSMFLDHAWKQACGHLNGALVLDLCAAPGGKSTLLAAQPNISLLLSNELIRSRVPVLYENVVKWGLPKMLVSSQDPKDFGALPGLFDAMLVDAPCSGSGLFRKDPEATSHWSPATVNLCSQRQQRILADALPALKAGGVLFYATCSYSLEEDEAVCDWLLDNMSLEAVDLEVPAEWGVVESRSAKHGATGYRFYPHRLQGEGFFLSVFRKTSSDDHLPTAGYKTNKPTAAESDVLRSWLNDFDDFRVFRMADHLLACPENNWEAYTAIASRFRLRRSGLRLGTFAYGQFNPDHELAMSTALHPGVDALDLSLEQALRYLRRESLDITSGEKGWVSLRYQGLLMGFAKRLPNRLNNYYPQEWRIRLDGKGEIG